MICRPWWSIGQIAWRSNCALSAVDDSKRPLETSVKLFLWNNVVHFTCTRCSTRANLSASTDSRLQKSTQSFLEETSLRWCTCERVESGFSVGYRKRWMQLDVGGVGFWFVCYSTRWSSLTKALRLLISSDIKLLKILATFSGSDVQERELWKLCEESQSRLLKWAFEWCSEKIKLNIIFTSLLPEPKDKKGSIVI